MAGTLASVLALVAVISTILILITALDWAFTQFFNPSSQDVMNLLTSLEDLALPRGSSLSEPQELSHESETSTKPTDSTDRPPISYNSSDQSSYDSPRNQQSQEEHSRNAGSAVDLPLLEQIVAELGALGIIANATNDEVQKNQKQQDEDSTAAAEDVSTEIKATEQQDENCTAALEQALTKSQAFEVAIRGLVDPDGSSVSNLEDVVELVANALKAEDVSTEIKATEQQDDNSTAALEQALTKSQAFEDAIRGLIDPDGSLVSNLEDVVELVANVLKGRAEAEEELKSEIIRFNRKEEELKSEIISFNRKEEELKSEIISFNRKEEELKSEIISFNRKEEDLRHDWVDQRGYLERVINGQNDFVADNEVENSRLNRENTGLKEKFKGKKEGYKREIELLKAEKQYAEDAKNTALAEVEGRISHEKAKHERERLAAEDRHRQAMNSELCKKHEVSKEVALTEERLNTAEVNYEAALQKKDKEISGLKTELRRVEPAVAAAVERETSTKDQLEKQLRDQRMDKDGEISKLQKQLREAEKEARSLKQSSSTLKSTAEWSQTQIQQLSTRFDEEKTSLREDRDRIVDDYKREKATLETVIRDGEAVINSLELKIAEFESGEEVRSLRRQLQVLNKKRRRSAKEAKKTSQEAKKTSKENGELKEQLAEVTRLAEKGHNQAVQEFQEQKEKLSREIEDVQSREEKMRADIQRVQNEKGQIATQQQTTVMEKDEEIMRLRQEVQLADERRQTATDYEKIFQEKDAEIGRLQQAVELAKQGEIAKNRAMEAVQAQVAVEKAAKDAADAQKITLQHQLDDDRQAFQVAQDKATETETNMRNEIIALKSEGSKVAEPHSDNPASDQTSKGAQEVAVLCAQANDANNLLLEIGKLGVVQGSPEHSTLCELNDAKLALHRFKVELRKPNGAASKPRLVNLIAGLDVNEERFQQFSLDTPQLVEQTRKTNARLRRLQKILDTNADLQKDAMLEALDTEIPNERVIRKPRALKRPGKPDSGTPANGPTLPSESMPKRDNPQPFADLLASLSSTPANRGDAQTQSGTPANGPAFPFKSMPKRDHRQPFADLLASVSPTPVIQVHAAPRQEPMAEDQPVNPGALGASLRPVSPGQPIRSIPDRGPQLAHSPSAPGFKTANENPMPQMPLGWTEAMTETVRENHHDNIENLEMIVLISHEYDPGDYTVFQEWLKKLQSDFRAEKS